MDTSAHPTATDPAIDLLEATTRYERARAEYDLAWGLLRSLAPDAPGRWYLPARRRFGTAAQELGAATMAYHAAQDVPCPE